MSKRNLPGEWILTFGGAASAIGYIFAAYQAHNNESYAAPVLVATSLGVLALFKAIFMVLELLHDLLAATSDLVEIVEESSEQSH